MIVGESGAISISRVPRTLMASFDLIIYKNVVKRFLKAFNTESVLISLHHFYDVQFQFSLRFVSVLCYRSLVAAYLYIYQSILWYRFKPSL